MTDHDTLPQTSLSPVYHYEELIESGDPGYEYPDLPEEAPAGMCYTSATTGNPKGVVYTHRSIFLHSLALGLADTTEISGKRCCHANSPMFRFNGWDLPFTLAWFGCHNGACPAHFTPKIILELIEQERGTFMRCPDNLARRLKRIGEGKL